VGDADGCAVIYLDHAATTACDPRVVERMHEAYGEGLANPHSTHAPGRRAAERIAEACTQIAGAVGAAPDDVILTSGATESNNLAITGVAPAHVITCRTEHVSVLRPCERIADVAYVPVDRGGHLDLDELVVRDDALVSLMWVNNEIGTVHDIAAIARIVHACGALLHVDATQALGRLPIDVRAHGIDLLTLSGHKIYGPQGTGALIASPRARRVLSGQIVGGSQQGGLRAGTVNTIGAIGLGLACELAAQELAETSERLAAATAHLRARLAAVPGVRWLSPRDAAPGIASVAFHGIDAADLLACLDGVALSTQAACHGPEIRVSHVLEAVGWPPDVALGAVRISLGKASTHAELDAAVAELATKLAFLRGLATQKGPQPWLTADSH